MKVGMFAALLLTTMAVAGGLAPGVSSAAATVGPASKAGATYYLAMGDSMAAGVGATQPSEDYVNLIYEHELTEFPALQVHNIACSGATTGSVINGPGCSYKTGTQLGDAEAFLRSHKNEVPIVTIDIGANDVDGCIDGDSINASCVSQGLVDINQNLPQILSGLRSAYPGIAIYGMDYYDPFLGVWLTGSSGQQLATQSEQYAIGLNTLLEQLYTAGGAATADPATMFQTTDFEETGSYDGQTEPQNVADVCNWTLFCSDGGNIHPNDIGHAVVAASFEQVIDGVTITTTGLPTASVGSKYGGQLQATGGHPPYTWALAPASGALPTGLKLKPNGTFAGKPKTTGDFTFTVQVLDTPLNIHDAPPANVATQTLTISVT
ncbi:MAG: GDSL-type esterase/lipase family protein [Acidimicrobiales bacterium]